MTKTYTYTVQGTAARRQTWTISGVVSCEFHRVFDTIMEQTFKTLTRGEAVYGRPGVGCSGPYDITDLAIKQAVSETVQ